MDWVESLLKVGARGDLIGTVILRFLFDAAHDQQVFGAKGMRDKWGDAMAKCKLLCLYFPDDQRLRDFMDVLQTGLGLLKGFR